MQKLNNGTAKAVMHIVQMLSLINVHLSFICFFVVCCCDAVLNIIIFICLVPTMHVIAECKIELLWNVSNMRIRAVRVVPRPNWILCYVKSLALQVNGY